jgi:hypothetical protein
MLPQVYTPKDLKSRDEWRVACQDLFFFEQNVCAEAFDDKFQDMGAIHMEMCDFLDTRKNSSKSKYLLAFRGSFKTTVILGYFAWFLCMNLARRKSNSILYNTAIKENAWNFSSDLKHLLLENQLLQWIFPELPKDEKSYSAMTKNRIEHGRVRMDFSSMDSTQASRHYSVIVNDDLENEKNYQTEGQRDDLKNAFMYQQSVLTKIKSRGIGTDIFVGTPYHIQGLCWKVRNDKTYSRLEIPCFKNHRKEDGVTFPERFEVDDFDVIKARQNTQVFSSQYDLRPLSEDDALCPDSWIQYWTRLPDPFWREMIVDPGGADPTSKDPTGITIVDTDTNGNMYVVLAEEFYFQPMQFMDKIKELKDNYAPDSIRIEKEKYWTTIADIFQHKFPELNISYAEHKGRNKDVRIWRLKQWFQGKRIFLDKNMKGSKFYTQLTEYPSVTHDDILDSLAYQLDYRRVPDPHIIHRLPSGKAFKPSVEESFEIEMDAFMARVKNADAAISNDHNW